MERFVAPTMLECPYTYVLFTTVNGYYYNKIPIIVDTMFFYKSCAYEFENSFWLLIFCYFLFSGKMQFLLHACDTVESL